MHDTELEDDLRKVLRAEGDEVPMTITAAELDRRLALRRRAHVGQRVRFLAAGVAVVLVGSMAVASNGWLRAPVVGSGLSAPAAASPAESVTPTSLAPTSPPSISPNAPCAPLDVAAIDRPPEVVLDVAPIDGPSSVHSGQLGAFRMAGRDVGNVASWDHDTRAFDAATTGVLGGITVLAIAPDTCLVGVTADAVPYGSIPAVTPATAVDSSAIEPRRLLAFRAPPVGDWFVRVHVVFQTTDGSEALSETFFRIRTEKQAILPPSPAECDPADPQQSTSPPGVTAGASPGDAMAFGGQATAHAWGGDQVGTPGSWAFPIEPDWIRVDAEIQTLEFISDSCLLEVTAEALLTQYASVPDSSPEPIPLVVLGGEGSRFVQVTPPPTGGWTIRVRATIATSDGSPAWSETLYAVWSAFHAPALTMSHDGGVAVSAAAGCPNYQLASGASTADTCGAPFTLNPAAIRMTATTRQSVTLALSDGWQIDGARVTAVDAGLVASGDFAPEHSVAFVEEGGTHVVVPMTLDPGQWIVRVALNGSRGGDSFDAYYDLAVEVTP